MSVSFFDIFSIEFRDWLCMCMYLAWIWLCYAAFSFFLVYSDSTGGLDINSNDSAENDWKLIKMYSD